MFYHRNMAVNGLSPNEINTRSIANQGTFETVVIIEPVIRSSGGGYVPVPRGQKPDRYRVTIKVTINGKTHQETQIVDDLNARVTARILGIEKFEPDTVMVSINGVQVFGEAEIQVRMKSTLLNIQNGINT